MAGVLGCWARPHVEPPEPMTDRTRQMDARRRGGTRDRTPVAAPGLLAAERCSASVALALLRLAPPGCAGHLGASSGAAPSSPPRSGIGGAPVGRRPARPRRWSGRAARRGRPLQLPPARRQPRREPAARRRPQALRDPARRRGRRRRRARFADAGAVRGGGAGETCFYIDVLPGTHHMLTFTAHEGRPTAGLSPTHAHRRVRTQGAVLVRRGRGALRAAPSGAARATPPRSGAPRPRAASAAASIPAARAW